MRFRGLSPEIYTLPVINQLPKVKPMPLVKESEPFNHAEWIYEIKYDGFRALAYVDNGQCLLVSRKGNIYKSFSELCEWIGEGLPVNNAILDGEIVCLDDQGKSVFKHLLHRHGEPIYFYAFDLLWLDGEDLRQHVLIERKERLRELLPEDPSYLLYLDHLREKGVELFQSVCEMDLEGIVAKWKEGPSLADKKTSWIKIKNPDYSQAVGRRELFDSFRR